MGEDTKTEDPEEIYLIKRLSLIEKGKVWASVEPYDDDDTKYIRADLVVRKTEPEVAKHDRPHLVLGNCLNMKWSHEVDGDHVKLTLDGIEYSIDHDWAVSVRDFLTGAIAQGLPKKGTASEPEFKEKP